MNIGEVAAAFDKPVSHIEAIARGYSQTGHESRPIPTDFDLIENRHAAELELKSGHSPNVDALAEGALRHYLKLGRGHAI